MIDAIAGGHPQDVMVMAVVAAHETVETTIGVQELIAIETWIDQQRSYRNWTTEYTNQKVAERIILIVVQSVSSKMAKTQNLD